MILANKSGWLIAVRVLRKTRAGHRVQPIDSERTTFVSRRDTTSKLCLTVGEAEAFVKGP